MHHSMSDEIMFCYVANSCHVTPTFSPFLYSKYNLIFRKRIFGQLNKFSSASEHKFYKLNLATTLKAVLHLEPHEDFLAHNNSPYLMQTQ